MGNLFFDLPDEIQDKIFHMEKRARFDEVLNEMEYLNNLTIDVMNYEYGDYHAFMSVTRVMNGKLMKHTPFKTKQGLKCWSIIQKRYIYKFESNCLVYTYNFNFTCFGNWELSHYILACYRDISPSAIMMFGRMDVFDKNEMFKFCSNNGLTAYKSWKKEKLWKTICKFNFPNKQSL